MVLVPLEAVTEAGKLDLIYRTQLDLKETIVALQDQISELTTRIGIVETALTTVSGKLGELQASVDAEQQQVADALALITADNPDLAAAITKLQSASTNLDALSTSIDATKADVESTVTP